MRSQRVIFVIVGLLAALVAAAPAAGATSTLLSGYGGPGQGNQAILGSSVVKGGGGGSRGGSGGSSSSGSTTQTQAAAAAAEESGPAPSLVASESPRPAKGASSTKTGTSTPRAPGSAPTTHGRPAASKHVAAQPAVAQASFYPASERLAPGQHDSALGLSGGDLLYLLLALAVLISLGVLTRRVGGPDGRRVSG
jgi:hypothetical protein